MKNSVKATNKNVKGLERLREKFLKFSDTKLKEGIFIGPQNFEILKDDLSENLLTATEKSAWLTFKAVCLGFFGKVAAENYKEIFEELLNAHQTLGV